MSKTKDNLGAAFSGESKANRKYLFFAEKADAEGYTAAAKLFRAAADAETVHARNHLKAMNDIRSSRENLMAAISGELYEFTKMYPEFIEQAEADGDKRALNSFDLANKVEKVHHDLFEEALRRFDEGEKESAESFHVCQVCGYTVEGEAPDNCPVCGAPRAKFKMID